MAHGLKSDREQMRRKVLALRELVDDSHQFTPPVLRQETKPLSRAAIGERLGITRRHARELGAKRRS